MDDASKKNGVCDSRAVYTPPCVVRISDLKQGAGVCATMGSGDGSVCGPTGGSATGSGCQGTGNNATGTSESERDCSTGNTVIWPH